MKAKRLFLWGGIASILAAGGITLLLLTDVGAGLVTRTVLARVNRGLAGTVTVGTVRGTIVRRLHLADVTVRDGRDSVRATAQSVQVRYRLRDVLAGRAVVRQLVLTGAEVDLVQDRPGRPPALLEIFARPATTPRASRTVELHDVTVVDAAVSYHTPERLVVRADTAVAPVPPGSARGRVEDIQAVFPLVRVTTVGAEGRSVRVDIAALGGRLSGFDVAIDRTVGRVELEGDSIVVDLPEVHLATSRLAVAGWAVQRDSVRRFDVALRAADLVSDELQPLLPAMPTGVLGRGDLRARMNAAGTMELSADRLAVETTDGSERALVRLTMQIAPDRPWTQRQTRLVLENFDLERIRPYVDTLPIAGRVSGVVVLDGSREGLHLDVDGSFRDSLVRDQPTSTLRASGHVSLDDPAGPVFTQFRVERASVMLASLRRMMATRGLDGAVEARGVVDGPWRAPRFGGALAHVRTGRRASELRGAVQLDTRVHPPRFRAEIDGIVLQDDALRAVHPELGAVGPLTGRARVSGSLDSLVFDGRLDGSPGEVAARGSVSWSPERYWLKDLRADARRVNLAALRPELPASDLTGSLTGDIEVRPGVDRRWRMHGTMQQSVVRGTQIDSAIALLRGTDSLITVDTLEVLGSGWRAAGGGTIALRAPRRGTVRVQLQSDSVGALEPLLAEWIGGLAVDTGKTASGRFAADLRATGSLDDYDVAATFEGDGLRRDNAHAAALRGSGEWASSMRRLRFEAQADSLRFGDLEMRSARALASGTTDSLRWSGDVLFRADGELRGGGALIRDGSTVFVVDSLALRLGSSRWMARDARVRMRDTTIEIADLTLASTNGRSRLAIDGRVPGVRAGQLTATIEALPLAEVAAPWGPRFAGIGGEVNGALRLSGTADAPSLVLDVTLREPVFRTFRASLVEGRFRYDNQLLQGTFGVSRGGRRLVTVEGAVPVDLALRLIERRQVEGLLDIRGAVDSLDLSALEPFVTGVRGLRGTLIADVGITGSWKRPNLRGRLDVSNGAAMLPSLGVRHTGVWMALALSGDTVRLQRVTLSSGGGMAEIDGTVRLPELTSPQLDLRAAVRNLRLIDRRDLLTLAASGSVALRGPLFGATLTGRGEATRGVLFARDLLEKQVVNLADTVFAAYVDTTVLREEGLGTPVAQRFVRELRVDTLRLRMGSDFWMRSAEANVQLAGELSVSKSEEEYRVNGTLNATRGVYRFLLGPAVTRDFVVTRGDIRFFGTPDLNADLDIDTQHQVRSFRGTQVTVYAHLGGTVYRPRLTLSSDVRPPLSETEIVSYLLFGAPSVQAFAGSGGTQGRFVFQQSIDRFAAVMAGELESSLINGLGVPLDYLQIRPGDFSQGFSGTEIALGKQLNLLGRPAFLLASPRLCAQQLVSVRNVGASLEFHLSRHWLLAASVDPLNACETSTLRSLTRYQLGWDLFWERSR